MSGVSFYPEAGAGFEQQQQDNDGGYGGQAAFSAETGARRSSWASTGAFSGSWGNSTFPADQYGYRYGSDWSDWSQESGQWFWTPQIWVRGASRDEAIQTCIRKGWINVDRDFLDWWSNVGRGGHGGDGSSHSGNADSKASGRESHEGGDSGNMPVEAEEFGDEEGLGHDHSSTSKSERSGSKKPNTGKDLIPEHDGVVTMREYQRRVRIFQSTTSIDEEYQAGKLLEKLSGDAWSAAEMIDVQSLKQKDGVEILLKHLWNELEPLEFLRTFQTLSFFYKTFKRERGQEMVSYDMAFRAQCKRLAECGSQIEGTTKAFWYLEKASISDELRRQVVSSAGGDYNYTKLRNALVSIVPQVRRHEVDGDGSQ